MKVQLDILCSKILPGLALLACMSAGLAATTAQEQQAQWQAQARSSVAGFVPSAARGKEFFEKKTGPNPDMPGCASCHTTDPRASGKHAITGKTISPLSPLANADRFTDPAKSEKWFKRNCNDVLHRECSAAEKADLVEYLLKGLK